MGNARARGAIRGVPATPVGKTSAARSGSILLRYGGGFVSLLLLCAPGHAAQSEELLGAATREAIDRRFAERNDPERPGAAIAIVRDGRVVFAKGYGSADPERRLPITPTTLFDAGSVAKTFTGLGVARLIVEGSATPLELDADLRSQIREMQGLPAKLTLRHLLHHTSGLRDWPGGLVMGGGDFADRIDMPRVLRFLARQRELNAIPGLSHSYTNSGYVLLARWIEATTGGSFPEWMQEQVFEPLGMGSTRIPVEPGSPLAEAAVGYRYESGKFVRLPRNSAVWGSSSMWTNVLDLAQWMIELERQAALPPLSFALLTQPGKTAAGESISYGFGVDLGQWAGHETIGHGGLWCGFRAQWIFLPKERLGVAILSNDQSFAVGEVAQTVIGDLLGQAGADTGDGAAGRLSEQEADRLIGRYRLHPGFETEIFRVRDELRARSTGQGDFLLTPLSPSVLVFPRSDIRFAFELDREGPARAFVNHQHDRQTRWVRVAIEDGPAPESTDETELAGFVGTYPLWPGTLVEFRVEAGTLVVQATGEEAFPVRRLSRDRFHVDAYGAEFRFRRDGTGRPVALTYRGLDGDRLPVIPPEALRAFEGTYRSSELGVEYDVVLRDGTLFAEHARHAPIKLVPASPTRFLGEAWFFRNVEFVRDPRTERTRALISCERLVNVSFDRIEEPSPGPSPGGGTDT